MSVYRKTCVCNNSDPTNFTIYDYGCGVRCNHCIKEWLKPKYATGQTNCYLDIPQLGGLFKLFQPEKISRADLNYERVERYDDYTPFKIGSYLSWQRGYGINHAQLVTDVSEENGHIKLQVIHYKKVSKTVFRVEEEWINPMTQNGVLNIVGYCTSAAAPIELVIARAKSLRGMENYGVFTHNCEHIVSFCVWGCRCSFQIASIKQMITENAKKDLIKSPVALLFAQGAESLATPQSLQKYLGFLSESKDAIGVSIVVAVDTVYMALQYEDIEKLRREGKISRKDAITRKAEVICENMLKMGINVAFSFIPLAGLPIALILSSVFSISTRVLGTTLGRLCGSVINKIILTDDRAIQGLRDVKPGDHLVLTMWLLHPRCHLIVKCVLPENKMVVIRNTYKKGVVEETLEYPTSAVYKIQYHPSDCHPADEVIRRAMSRLGQNRYGLLYNCKHFARWCKMINLPSFQLP